MHDETRKKLCDANLKYFLELVIFFSCVTEFLSSAAKFINFGEALNSFFCCSKGALEKNVLKVAQNKVDNLCHKLFININIADSNFITLGK